MSEFKFLDILPHDKLHALLISKANTKFRWAFPFKTNSSAKIIARYEATFGKGAPAYQAWLKDVEAGYKWASSQPGGAFIKEIIKKTKGTSMFDKAVESLITSGALKGVKWP